MCFWQDLTPNPPTSAPSLLLEQAQLGGRSSGHSCSLALIPQHPSVPAGLPAVFWSFALHSRMWFSLCNPPTWLNAALLMLCRSICGVVLALMRFLANDGVQYGVLLAVIFTEDLNPLPVMCCKVKPDGNALV